MFTGIFAALKGALPILKYVFVVVLVVGALGGMYTYGQHVQKTTDTVAQQKEVIALQAQIKTETDRRIQISDDFMTKLDNIKIVNTTINNTLPKEIQKTVYTTCKLPDSGVQLLQNNIQQLNAARHGTSTK
jgi:hypothetical protein